MTMLCISVECIRQCKPSVCMLAMPGVHVGYTWRTFNPLMQSDQVDGHAQRSHGVVQATVHLTSR